jgi:toxin ParE1/3/4
MIADFDVRLTRGAEIDLEALHGYVKDNRSVEQADSLLDRLLAAIETLETFPLRGSVPKELGALGIREFRQILVEPYRLIYRLSGKTVFVMVIADGRRDTHTPTPSGPEHISGLVHARQCPQNRVASLGNTWPRRLLPNLCWQQGVVQPRSQRCATDHSA